MGKREVWVAEVKTATGWIARDTMMTEEEVIGWADFLRRRTRAIDETEYSEVRAVKYVPAKPRPRKRNK